MFRYAGYNFYSLFEIRIYYEVKSNFHDSLSVTPEL